MPFLRELKKWVLRHSLSSSAAQEYTTISALSGPICFGTFILYLFISISKPPVINGGKQNHPPSPTLPPERALSSRHLLNFVQNVSCGGMRELTFIFADFYFTRLPRLRGANFEQYGLNKQGKCNLRYFLNQKLKWHKVNWPNFQATQRKLAKLRGKGTISCLLCDLVCLLCDLYA